ncbi:site-specific integrase, partial [Priestia megaterium]|uniref:site-specific integrase n=1 Tax=Priestia megaterium TaxID=1404 RepID=UPI00227E89C8
MNIPLLVQRFLIHLHETGKKKSTVSMYKHDLMAFFNWLNQRYPHITPETLPEEKSCYEEYLTYLKDKNLSEANLRRVASHLNRLLEYHNLTDRFGALKATTKKQRDLVDSDFITEKDTFSLLSSVVSKKNLTETQLQI